MILWQATWNPEGELLVWAERSWKPFEGAASAEPDSPTEPPWSVPSDELFEHIAQLEFEPDRKTQISLLLPSDELGPLSSPRTRAPRELSADSTIEFKRWQIPAVAFEPAHAISFLTTLPQEENPPLRCDASLEYWIEATKLLLELLTRGRLIPGMFAENNSYRSFWHLVPADGDDKDRLRTLADAMPPICRAARIDDDIEEAPPSRLLESFVAVCGNSLIRSFLTRSAEELRLDGSVAGSQLGTLLSWLASLAERDGAIDSPLYELIKLEQRLGRWNQIVSPATKHSPRTAFRLIPPEASENTGKEEWRLEFLIQSQEDPSRYVTAEDLWRGELGFLRFSEYRQQDLEDKLLGNLGRAGKIFAPIAQALSSTFPTHATISTSEAYEFLKETTRVFEELGLGIVLPDWWHEPNAGLGLKLTVNSDPVADWSTRGRSFIGLNELLDFSWEISLGKEELSVEQFKSLVEQNSPLIAVDGQWIELPQEQIRSALKFLESQSHEPKMRLLEALRLGLGVEAETQGLPVVKFEARGWIERLIEESGNAIPRIEQPSNFKGDLRPYQLEGLSWMMFHNRIGCGACLADDMGLGKTVQLLALLLHEREIAAQVPDSPVYPTLLIVPMSILDNWEREASRFAPSLRVYLHHGSSRLGRESFAEMTKNIDLVITTYSLAYRDEQMLQPVIWGRVALDEAQNIKNLSTKQTQAVRRLIYHQLNHTDRASLCDRLALTGTPLENHLEELWSIFDFLNPGYLGNVREFRSRFVIPIERYRDKQMGDALAKVVRPFVMRRLKTDRDIINDLPEKIEMEIDVGLTQEQAALYQRVVESMIPQVEKSSGIKRKGLVLAAITKLKQICNHPQLYLKEGGEISGRSAKLARLEELLEVIIAEGDRVLIFTQFAQMGHLLKAHLEERFNQEVLFLYGGIPQKARHKLIDRFQSESGPTIFVLSLKVGGIGLNLTAANQIIHFDQWWNPAVEDQATDRAFRIGQKRNVQVRKFICKGTLEERIAAMLSHKKDLADSIVRATKSEITELSTDQLRDLLSLTADYGSFELETPAEQ